MGMIWNEGGGGSEGPIASAHRSKLHAWLERTGGATVWSKGVQSLGSSPGLTSFVFTHWMGSSAEVVSHRAGRLIPISIL